MVDRLQMILERLAADRDPLLDDERRLGGAQGVPLDRVRRVGQLEIVDVLEVAEAGAYYGTQSIELGLLRGDLYHEIVHLLFLSQRQDSVRDPCDAGIKGESVGRRSSPGNQRLREDAGNAACLRRCVFIPFRATSNDARPLRRQPR